MGSPTNGNLRKLIKQYNVNVNQPSPIVIPDANRATLAEMFGFLGFTIGAEIGVGGGTYSEIICKRCPDVKLYCIDAYVPYPGYPDFLDDTLLERDYQDARDRLKPYDVEIIRKFSMDTVKDFKDNSLDFVYIDANHVMPWIGEDIQEWSKKVRRGGIISGHDYILEHDHVIAAVDGYANEHDINPYFLVGVTISGNYPECIPSWFWVKP